MAVLILKIKINIGNRLHYNQLNVYFCRKCCVLSTKRQLVGVFVRLTMILFISSTTKREGSYLDVLLFYKRRKKYLREKLKRRK